MKLDVELSFEIRDKDLLGRIGLLRTRHGTVETPLLLPVVNPISQVIPAKELADVFGFDALITNSYLVWRRFHAEQNIPKIHELLNYDHIIVTDSGAYQILQYGDVEVRPSQIVRFQEKLDSDIAVILDVPTGQEASKERAKLTVDETLRRADEALGIISKKDILWVGPVQGGIYLDLVSYAAHEMAKRDFAIHALGSPTPVMEQYQFDVLVDMIMAAKLNLPPDRPLHLFGAGHPMMFALAVALGCDIFDSASYALFARNSRYMTVQGTAKLEDLQYFPCNCPTCHNRTPQQVRTLLPTEREKFLASHNLRVCSGELQTIKQATVDGRLWELVEARSRNHPALHRAFQSMLRYSKQMERETPLTKKKGPFVAGDDALNRPEILRHQERLLDRYRAPSRARTVILLPEKYLRPFRESSSQDTLRKLEQRADLHLCSYGLAYGVIPIELQDVYPLSQTEVSLSPTRTSISFASKRILSYLNRTPYRNCITVVEEAWHVTIAKSVRTKFRRRMKIRIIKTEDLDDANLQIKKALQELSPRRRIS